MAAQAKSRSEAKGHGDIVVKLAEKYAIDPDKLLLTLKATAFKQPKDGPEITDEQMYSLLVVSDQYNLNPFTREIYAFPDKRGGIIPVVGVDGWNRIANEHPQFNGVEFVYSDTIVQMEGARAPCHIWIEAVLHRKDRANPVRVREYLDECYRAPFKDWQTGYESIGPWQTHPKRFLRHKSLIQCYRVGFSFVGIYDEDEAYRILEAQSEDGKTSATVVPFKKVEPQALEHQPSQTLDEFFENDFNRVEVDAFLAKLVKRAQAANQWQAAEDLIDERLKGQAAVYAKQELTKARNQDGSVDGHEETPEQADQSEPADTENQKESSVEPQGEQIQMALPGKAGVNYF
ncbi:MAG: phage recombination protein Bet [gamma proteobacterium symbiont of Clathrolucina costata]